MLYQLVLGICPYDFRKIPQYLWYFVVTAVIVFFKLSGALPVVTLTSKLHFHFFRVFKGSLILENCITFAFNRGNFFKTIGVSFCMHRIF